jgi:hypothetical protein
MLLIVTSESDLAADYLILRLIERGRPYLRINSEQLAQYGATFRVTKSHCKRYIVTPNGQSIDLSDITAVWYRRSIDPIPFTTLPFAQRRFVAGELRQLWTGLVLDPTIKWVNPIEKVYVGEHKVLQLRLASQQGFRVPETLISTNANELSEFVIQVGSAICKPIFHGLYIDGQDRYSVYTRRVTSTSLAEQSTIDLCPVFVQQEIQRSADLRITFIGERCFCVRITSNDPALIDWRIPGTTLSNTIIEVTQDIKTKCLVMMNSMGLRYAAFDFIETPTGELVFLEVNPTGEWAWLEDQLGLPMRDAFIELFYGE